MLSGWVAARNPHHVAEPADDQVPQAGVVASMNPRPETETEPEWPARDRPVRGLALDGKTVRLRHEVACREWVTVKEVLMVT